MEISSQNGDGFKTLYRWLWLWTIFVLFFLFFSFQNFLFEGPWDSLETKRCILMVQPFIIYIYIQIQTMYRSCNRPYESDFHCCSCMVNFLFYVTCVRIASLDSHILHSPLLIISGFTVHHPSESLPMWGYCSNVHDKMTKIPGHDTSCLTHFEVIMVIYNPQTPVMIRDKMEGC